MISAVYCSKDIDPDLAIRNCTKVWESSETKQNVIGTLLIIQMLVPVVLLSTVMCLLFWMALNICKNELWNLFSSGRLGYHLIKLDFMKSFEDYLLVWLLSWNFIVTQSKINCQSIITKKFIDLAFPHLFVSLTSLQLFFICKL